MTEEVKVVEPTEVTPEVQVEEKQSSSIESKAIEMGWRPKDEFNGDEEDFIDAKEFVRRQPLFDKISQQGQQLRKMNEAFHQFKTHHATVEQKAYDRAIKELRSKQELAIEEGDLKKYHSIQEDIDEQRDQARQAQEVAQENAPADGNTHPEFQSWVSANPWYNANNHMKVFADEYGLQLARQGLSPKEVLKTVEKAVRVEFPNKFRNPNKDSAPVLESSSNTSNKRGASKEYPLTDMQRKVMNTLVSSGALTKEQYIAEIRNNKGD